MIELKKIKMRYKGNHYDSLNNIDIKINEGNIIALIGPNGAGKTTIIKIISGILRPTAYERIDISGVDPYGKDKKKHHVGLILNSNQLYEDLTAYENIMFYLKLNKVKKSRDEINKVLNHVGLSNKDEILVKKFSTGMKQKLSIAKILLIDCKLLILDEPTSGMDPVSKSEIYQLLEQVNKKYHTTIIISSHVMNEVEKISNDVIFLNHGEVTYQGSLDQLKAEFSRQVTEVYCSDDKLNSLNSFLKDQSYKFFHQETMDYHKFIIFQSIDLYGYGYDKITIRPIELEDIFFYYVLGVKKC